MSKYIIKTVKEEEGKYSHQFFDEKGDTIKPNTVLENNKTASDFLYYYSIAIVPFMRTTKSGSLELKIEVKKE
jgi:hypothetical protein